MTFANLVNSGAHALQDMEQLLREQLPGPPTEAAPEGKSVKGENWTAKQGLSDPLSTAGLVLGGRVTSRGSGFAP